MWNICEDKIEERQQRKQPIAQKQQNELNHTNYIDLVKTILEKKATRKNHCTQFKSYAKRNQQINVQIENYTFTQQCQAASRL